MIFWLGAGVLALIDRNFQGFGKELFTDAGKYVIHFGDRPAAAAEQVCNFQQLSVPSLKPQLEHHTAIAQFWPKKDQPSRGIQSLCMKKWHWLMEVAV